MVNLTFLSVLWHSDKFEVKNFVINIDGDRCSLELILKKVHLLSTVLLEIQ